MLTLAETFKAKRKERQIRLREISAQTGIDAALLSKFERGERLPTEEQARSLAASYGLPPELVRKLWLAEKVWQLVRYEPNAAEVLAVAERRMDYLRSERELTLPPLPPELLDQLATLDQLRAEWQARKPLAGTQLDKMRAFFNIEYTFESNRIEGNTLSLQETKLVVAEGLTIGGKTMREHLEAINHAEAADFILDLAARREDLSRRTLLELHALVLKTIDRQHAGRYRSVPVRISGSRHEPPEPYLLDQLMEDYFRHYEQQKHTLHPVLLAADMHERLVSIHPFLDGNGRTARLVMNLILLRNGYTIATLKGDPASRLAYYKALEKVQVDNAPDVFYQLVAEVAERSLREHLGMV